MSEEIPRYKRIVLKLSGESLKGDQAFGIAEAVITDIASQLKQVAALGVEVAVVVGGGNFFRGVRSNNIGIDRSSADYMGMMATIMNGIALRDVLLNLGVEAHHVSPFHIPSVTGPFILLDVIRCLTQKHIVIFSGGTGITPTDITIETVTPFFEKTLPGFGEFFRRISYDKVGSAAVLSRATAGVVKGKAVFCIPGSPEAVKTSVEMLILAEAPHIVKHAREQR